MSNLVFQLSGGGFVDGYPGPLSGIIDVGKCFDTYSRIGLEPKETYMLLL